MNLFLFFGAVAMILAGGWCIYTALVGLSADKKERTWERITVWWTGRILLALIAFSLIIAASWGTMKLILFVISN